MRLCAEEVVLAVQGRPQRTRQRRQRQTSRSAILTGRWGDLPARYTCTHEHMLMTVSGVLADATEGEPREKLSELPPFHPGAIGEAG